ncbi:MAG TPA: gamma-glutamyl-gamma-aminobutyrate hydrolase family protein [bacterium]|nr:gamma-glutamyl-gamma-aminobutyrate hydrolase family protein [bacterium]
MRRPRIAFTWPRRAPRTPDHYLDVLVAAGGEPLVLTPETDLAALAAADGVLLAGGLDVHPSLYHQEIDPRVAETVEIDGERDRLEMMVVGAALGRDLPIFGICRGHQTLNVALGGTLVQDLSLRGIEVPTHHQRRRQPRPAESEPVHRIRVAPGSRLAAILGSEEVAVNSFHHQVVDQPAPGLRVVATAEDGVIEALEAEDGRFLLSVQWHPERMARTDDRQAALFAAFVEAARARSRTADPLTR